MVFKGAATIVARISRAIISRPPKLILTSRVYENPELNKNPQINVKYPARYQVFPSMYRSFFGPYRLPNGHYHQYLSQLIPFRMVLNELKRRLFFAGSYFHSSLSLSLFSSFTFRIHAYHYSQFFYPLDSNEKQRRGKERSSV